MMTLVRVYGMPGRYGVNHNGTRLITTRGLLSVRAMLRDIYYIHEMPPLRDDQEPFSAEEEAEVREGTTPGIDHGYGVGSGRIVISAEQYDSLWANHS